MLKKLEFKQTFIDPLSVFYGIPTEDQTETLFNLFRDNPPEVLSRAVEIVQQEYKYKTFPAPAYLHQAIDESRAEYAYINRDFKEDTCDTCYGMGMYLEKKYDEFYRQEKELAVFCTCPAGQKLRRTQREHYKKHKYYRNKAKIHEIPQEDPY